MYSLGEKITAMDCLGWKDQNKYVLALGTD